MGPNPNVKRGAPHTDCGAKRARERAILRWALSSGWRANDGEVLGARPFTRFSRRRGAVAQTKYKP